MLKPSQVHHSHCQTACKEYVPDTFTLLSWNIYKQNRSQERFVSFVENCCTQSPDFLMLQEAQFHPGKECILDTYAYEAAANIEVDKGYYGVLTASKSTAVEAKAFLSEEKELLIATHKSLLLSKYRFKDGRELLLVNVHAINFRENRAYEREKKRLEAFLSSYPGAVILSGDFNTWSSTRQKILQKSISKLNLTQVPFSDNDQVKSFMGNHLDMVFYRGLTLLDHTVLDDEGISDHRPLFIRFSLQEDISS